jgi:dipeptidyl aminopeptidase/acylaminoacyl peptidase
VFLSGLVIALLPGERGAAVQESAPTIPDRVAEYSQLTGNVSSSPPGRGIALFQFGFGVEFLDFPQAVVVGADGDVYRRVDLAEDAAGRTSQGDPGPMLLSPDGTRVAVGNYDTDRPAVAVVDLASGRVDRHAVQAGRGVLPLAWSPDGRRLAYLGSPEPWNPHADGPIAGNVGVLDLETGRAAALPGGSDVHTVAFSPDGTELAVQHTDGALEVLSLDGEGGRDLPLSADHRLAGPAAWSPDGALVAIRRSGGSVAFVDATGRSGDTPDPLDPRVVSPGHVLGWTAPDRVAVLVADPVGDAGPDQHTVLDVPLDGGDPRRLSAISTSEGRYGVGQFQPAAGLLPDLEVREAGDVDRGRWPLWLRLAAALAAGAAAAGAAGLVRRRLRPRGAASP